MIASDVRLIPAEAKFQYSQRKNESCQGCTPAHIVKKQEASCAFPCFLREIGGGGALFA
jgi:hypothetical protein